jgi:hypothetical protein
MPAPTSSRSAPRPSSPDQPAHPAPAASAARSASQRMDSNPLRHAARGSAAKSGAQAARQPPGRRSRSGASPEPRRSGIAAGSRAVRARARQQRIEKPRSEINRRANTRNIDCRPAAGQQIAVAGRSVRQGQGARDRRQRRPPARRVACSGGNRVEQLESLRWRVHWSPGRGVEARSWACPRARCSRSGAARRGPQIHLQDPGSAARSRAPSP